MREMFKPVNLGPFEETKHSTFHFILCVETTVDITHLKTMREKSP